MRLTRPCSAISEHKLTFSTLGKHLRTGLIDFFLSAACILTDVWPLILLEQNSYYSFIIDSASSAIWHWVKSPKNRVVYIDQKKKVFKGEFNHAYFWKKIFYFNGIFTVAFIKYKNISTFFNVQTLFFCKRESVIAVPATTTKTTMPFSIKESQCMTFLLQITVVWSETHTLLLRVYFVQTVQLI